MTLYDTLITPEQLRENHDTSAGIAIRATLIQGGEVGKKGGVLETRLKSTSKKDQKKKKRALKGEDGDRMLVMRPLWNDVGPLCVYVGVGPRRRHLDVVNSEARKRQHGHPPCQASTVILDDASSTRLHQSLSHLSLPSLSFSLSA